jgi:hypothetical protein
MFVFKAGMPKGGLVFVKRGPVLSMILYVSSQTDHGFAPQSGQSLNKYFAKKIWEKLATVTQKTGTKNH